MEYVNNLARFFIISFVCFFSVMMTNGQDYKGIIPLQSNCEDVKRNLNVNNCSYPSSTYETEDSFIYVRFTKEKPDKEDRVCWKVPVGTVSSIVVNYKKAIPLSEYKSKLKFVEGPIDDIFTMVYKNQEGNLEARAIKNSIYMLIYQPTETERKQKSYYCKSPDAGDDFETPTLLVERYWNVSDEEENQILIYSIRVFRESSLSKEIYIVYYYKNDNDKNKGLKRANQAKNYLEKYGMKSEQIKIFNGGKENKSEIVIYINY